VTVPDHPQVVFVTPQLKRNHEVMSTLYAYCTPYSSALPDTYTLSSQEKTPLGFASIGNIQLSLELRKRFTEKIEGLPVEVAWNDNFKKYQITRILPENTPVASAGFFHHLHSA